MLEVRWQPMVVVNLQNMDSTPNHHPPHENISMMILYLAFQFKRINNSMSLEIIYASFKVVHFGSQH